MGRLFNYNRLSKDNNTSKACQGKQPKGGCGVPTKENHTFTTKAATAVMAKPAGVGGTWANYHPYSEVYPAVRHDDRSRAGVTTTTTAAAAATTRRTTSAAAVATATAATSVTVTTTTSAAAAAAKNVELAIKKYQQWSSKFLLATSTAATATRAATPQAMAAALPAQATRDPVSQTTSSAATTSCTRATTTAAHHAPADVAIACALAAAAAAPAAHHSQRWHAAHRRPRPPTPPRRQRDRPATPHSENAEDTCRHRPLASPITIGGTSCCVGYRDEDDDNEIPTDQDDDDDCESLLATSRRPARMASPPPSATGKMRANVYDFMKDFLRRKLFQPNNSGNNGGAAAARTTAAMRSMLPGSSAVLDGHYRLTEKYREVQEAEEDVTSDYDEIDMLDSSYNADEEEEEEEEEDDASSTDCSTCPIGAESSSEDEEILLPPTAIVANTPSRSLSLKKPCTPQKSLLSLNCWQNSACAEGASTEEEDEDEEEDASTFKKDLLLGNKDELNLLDGPQRSFTSEGYYHHHQEEDEEESDAGISDCCQLIASEKNTPRRRQRRSLKPRYNRSSAEDDDNTAAGDLPELLHTSWYQPRISAKAVHAHLQYAAPGAFLVRRKQRSFELCLRVEAKVKQFPVIVTLDDRYKLKGARKQFSSLQALVTHHSVMAEQLPVTLTLPRGHTPRKPAGRRCADDFDTFESQQMLDILRSLQAKSLEFA